MTGYDDLIVLAKAKLNITWDDEGTNARVASILAESIPTVSTMVGLEYDYSAQDALDENGDVFDYSEPSQERAVLLNYVAYEWNHCVDTFWPNYWQMIAACRQRHELAEDALEESEDSTDDSAEDSTEDSTDDTEESDTDADSDTDSE